MHYYKGNPSKLPILFAYYLIPRKNGQFNDPCLWGYTFKTFLHLLATFWPHWCWWFRLPKGSKVLTLQSFAKKKLDDSSTQSAKSSQTFAVIHIVYIIWWYIHFCDHPYPFGLIVVEGKLKIAIQPALEFDFIQYTDTGGFPCTRCLWKMDMRP